MLPVKAVRDEPCNTMKQSCVGVGRVQCFVRAQLSLERAERPLDVSRLCGVQRDVGVSRMLVQCGWRPRRGAVLVVPGEVRPQGLCSFGTGQPHSARHCRGETFRDDALAGT